jgi:hypothetical protein
VKGHESNPRRKIVRNLVKLNAFMQNCGTIAIIMSGPVPSFGRCLLLGDPVPFPYFPTQNIQNPNYSPPSPMCGPQDLQSQRFDSAHLFKVKGADGKPALSTWHKRISLAYFVNLKFAVCLLPSFSFRVMILHCWIATE